MEFSIEAPGVGYYYNGILDDNRGLIVDLPTSVEMLRHHDRDKGICVITNSDQVTVIGQNTKKGSSGSFYALPISKMNYIFYVYYGISTTVPGSNRFSSILIVGTENNTMIRLTVTHPVSIRVTLRVDYLRAGREYKYVINRLQTVYIGSPQDLTGTKIIANKPISVLSGHECAQVPWNVPYCDYLIEQIPPTVLWGKVYYIAPLVHKTSYTIKVLAAYNSTLVTIYCSNNFVDVSYTINEGEFFNISLSQYNYCSIHSNKNVLVVQFSHGSSEDNNYGDPMMTLVPSTNLYSNRFDFSTIYPTQLVNDHYVNIIVTAQYYQANMIYMIERGLNLSLAAQQWVPIQVNGTTEAYAIQLVLHGSIIEICHSNPAAQMMVIVYGFARKGDGYGHIGGIRLPTG